MKKSQLILIFGITLFSFSFVKGQNKSIKNGYRNGREFSGKMTNDQIRYIKDFFSWNSKDNLLINYNYSSDKCYWNSYVHKQGETRYWKKFYSKVNLENSKKIYVYAPNELNIRDRKILDSNNFFEDNDNFLFNNFFYRETRKVCFGIIVLNRNGKYYQFNGEYLNSYVNEYLQKLEKK